MKQHINLTIDPELITKAKRQKINISHVAETALRSYLEYIAANKNRRDYKLE